MYPHRIRLRGPWECKPIATADRSAPRSSRVTMPCRWPAAGLAGFRGTAWFLRKFGYPGRIDTFEHVWLLFTGCTGCREIRLNGQVLTAADPENSRAETFTFEVTSLLTARNHLEVLIEGESDEAGLWGEVALEIRRGAWLSDVEGQATPTGLQVTGRAIGAAPQPLEMYTIVDNRHADYRTIQPTPSGQSFHIDLPGFPSHPRTIRVELIDVSTVWYAVELLMNESGEPVR
jgi:hypothetical protein